MDCIHVILEVMLLGVFLRTMLTTEPFLGVGDDVWLELRGGWRDFLTIRALLVVFSSNGNISFGVTLLIPISLLNLGDVLNIHVLKLLGLGEDLGFCLLNLDFHLLLVLT